MSSFLFLKEKLSGTLKLSLPKFVQGQNQCTGIR